MRCARLCNGQTSSGETAPFMSFNPFRCFPGPIRIACRFSSLHHGQMLNIRDRQGLWRTRCEFRDSRHLSENRLRRRFAV